MRMKRFASHYLYLPEVGFIKQHVVSLSSDEGYVKNAFPLTEEVESVEWLPGVIVLLPTSKVITDGLTSLFHYPCPVLPDTVASLQYFFSEMKRRKEECYAYLLYPFDFTSMQPVDETRHRLLR